MSRAFRFAPPRARALARSGDRIGQMRLTVPAGTLGTALDRVRVAIAGWTVRNEGGIEGWIGGRIELQLAFKVAGVPIREDTIIDGWWSPGGPPYTGRLIYSGLSALTSTTDMRRILTWDPMPYLVAPGATVNPNFNLLIGIELLAGMTDIDIVASIERLDTLRTLPVKRRWPDAFSVEPYSPAPAAFDPLLIGSATVSVFPF